MDNLICGIVGVLLSCSYILVYLYGKSHAVPPVYIYCNHRCSKLFDELQKENIRLTDEQLKRISERVSGYTTIGFEGKDADVRRNNN